MTFNPFMDLVEEANREKQVKNYFAQPGEQNNQEPINPFLDLVQQPQAQPQKIGPLQRLKQDIQEKSKAFEKEKGSHAALRRNTNRLGARALETGIGLPGSIQKTAESVAEWLVNKIAEKKGIQPAEQQEQTLKYQTPIADFMRKLGVPVDKKLPTVEQNRAFTKDLTGNFLEPRNAVEAFGDVVTEDLVTLAVPVKGKIPFGRALTISLGSNAAAELVGAVGGSEKAQAYTKMGTMLAGAMYNPKGAEKYVDGLYKKADELLPKGAAITSEEILPKLEKLKKTLAQGSPTGTVKRQPKIFANQLIAKAKKGRLSIEDLAEFRRDITTEAQAQRLFEAGGRQGMARAKRYMSMVSETVDDAIDSYGKQNPAYVKAFREATHAKATLYQSERIGKNISKAIDAMPEKVNSMTGSLFSLPGKAIKGTVKIGAKAAQGTTGLLSRIAKDPLLRKYYTNVVRNAAKGNQAVLVKDIARLNDELEKD